ncbi:MAG: hypothetical protein ACW99U_17120, partial [Candidatus Thorarchaeota archaeon]
EYRSLPALPCTTQWPSTCYSNPMAKHCAMFTHTHTLFYRILLTAPARYVTDGMKGGNAVTGEHPFLHFIVYDLGRPWKRGPELALDYMRAFRKCTNWEAMSDDLAKLYDLKGDSYDAVLGQWDGLGVTPTWLVRDYKAVGHVYVSHARLRR